MGHQQCHSSRLSSVPASAPPASQLGLSNPRSAGCVQGRNLVRMWEEERGKGLPLLAEGPATRMP